MKNFIKIFILLIIVNIIVPVLYLKICVKIDEFNTVNKYNNKNSISEKIKLYNTFNNTVDEINLLDYLIGSAACEMPASYEKEAIKAQMVAIHSYYEYCKKHPENLENGYITYNQETFTGYADKNKLNGLWASNFYDYYEKYKSCAEEVKNEIIEYNNQPALATYFAVSCGKTDNCENQWKEALPYLISVESDMDGISNDYLKIKNLSSDEMYVVLKANFPLLQIDQNTPEEWFKDISYYPSGYTQFVTVGIDKIPGTEFRKALSLPSSCIAVIYDEGSFSVVTKGYGHGIGMSQFGANQMALNGYTYKDILKHYYPHTEIKTEV